MITVGAFLFHQHCAVCFCRFQIGWYIGLALDDRFHPVMGGSILECRRCKFFLFTLGNIFTGQMLICLSPLIYFC